MPIDYSQFYQAIDPSQPLNIANEIDRQRYIDFTAVRGDKVIKKLANRIVTLSPDKPTCSLFTGHIGCGKSTELHRLECELKQAGFFVVYSESEDLDMADVDIIDVLMAIAKRIAAELEAQQVSVGQRLGQFIGVIKNALMTEIELKASAKLLGLGKAGFDTEKKTASVSSVIGELTIKAKNDPSWREKLNQYVGPQLNVLLQSINQDLIEPGIAQLKTQGYKGLVVIVDNLDRIDARVTSSGRSQREYLFVDRGENLAQLACHTIYSMPLSLRFSSEFGNLTQRFDKPECLPMVAVIDRQGKPNVAGLDKLKQMVLARAFPELDEADRLTQVGEIFAEAAAFDRLCRVSGGHVRDLLRLLKQWLEEEMELPLTMETLDDTIAEFCNEMKLAVSAEEWELLRQVRETHEVSDEQGYQQLIQSRLVFEYRDRQTTWFDVNPILLEAGKL